MLPGAPGVIQELLTVAVMNIPSGAGETEEVATTESLAVPFLLSQSALVMVTTSGLPVTGGNVTGALTGFACGHKLLRKMGSCIGVPQGAGESCPTTGELVPGPFNGPEPQ